MQHWPICLHKPAKALYSQTAIVQLQACQLWPLCNAETLRGAWTEVCLLQLQILQVAPVSNCQVTYGRRFHAHAKPKALQYWPVAVTQMRHDTCICFWIGLQVQSLQLAPTPRNKLFNSLCIQKAIPRQQSLQEWPIPLLQMRHRLCRQSVEAEVQGSSMGQSPWTR